MIVAILAILVVTMTIMPAYAVIVELATEKTSYKKGDQIIFIGKTDTAHANKIVAIRIADPSGKGVLLREVYVDGNGNFKTPPIDTSSANTAAKLTMKGVYNATAFYSQEPQPQKIWKFTLFDYSADGSKVSPSAADLMKQSQAASPPPTTPTPPPNTPPPTSTPSATTPPTTQQPTTSQPQQTQPTCGTGTVLKDGVCVVAESEPEPEPESKEGTVQGGPKKTHIPGFPDPTKDPQYYIDRYNNEPKYKEWFDRNFPEDSIYEILGVPGPKKTHIPGFPDPTKDPQYYIDRYNNEPKYKEWFDRNFPGETIYEIVGAADLGDASSCGAGTHLENGMCVLDKSKGGLFGGGCLIATAAYGTELAPQVQQLRELRDNTISKTSSGVAFMSVFNTAYYAFSPTISDLERENVLFREAIKVALTPMLSTLSLLNYADIDSEHEIIGYGLGTILLNIGMYFVAPAFAIVKLREFVRSRS